MRKPIPLNQKKVEWGTREEDWNAIQETLHLLSVPGMRESIREGLATPVDECGKAPGW